MDDMCQGLTIQRLTCTTCHTPHSSSQPTHVITLQIPQHHFYSHTCMLEDLLDSTFNGELEGITCTHCMQLRPHRQQSGLAQLPPVLFLHVNRCISTGGKLVNFQIQVEAPVQLDMSTRVISAVQGCSQVYALVAMVRHSGTALSGSKLYGHYIACMRGSVKGCNGCLSLFCFASSHCSSMVSCTYTAMNPGTSTSMHTLPHNSTRHGAVGGG